MPTVAEQLRSAREAKNLTIEQVAETTKIRTDYLCALEQGNYDIFSAPVYIRGSVKTCAMTFKLDVAKIMTDLDRELKSTSHFRKPPPLSDQSRPPLKHVIGWLEPICDLLNLLTWLIHK